MPAQAVKTLIVVCGPTAVGKTRFAIALAEKLHTEIISADSRQLYKEILIGTAQPSTEELQRVKHHFVGNLLLEEDYNAGVFERNALELLENLFQEHDTVVCCGGTVEVRASGRLLNGPKTKPNTNKTTCMEVLWIDVNRKSFSEKREGRTR